MSPTAYPNDALDYEAFERTPLRRDPFDHLVLEQFIPPTALSAAARDFPAIADAGTYRPEQLDIRGGFKTVMDGLTSDAFRQAVERKFDVELGGGRTWFSIRRFVLDKDNLVHRDNPLTQTITLKLYLDDGPCPGGELRLLRSDDPDDVLVEAQTSRGSLTVFRPCDRSWHVNRRYGGELKQLQLNWGPELLHAG